MDPLTITLALHACQIELRADGQGSGITSLVVKGQPDVMIKLNCTDSHVLADNLKSLACLAQQDEFNAGVERRHNTYKQGLK